MPVATWTPVPDPAPNGTPPVRRHRLVVVAAVLLATVWPAAWALRQGDLSALVGPGASRPLARAPGPRGARARRARPTRGTTASSSTPSPASRSAPEIAPYLTTPSYRYRRILFPLLAGAVAPHGGRRPIFGWPPSGCCRSRRARRRCVPSPAGRPGSRSSSP